MKKVSMLLMTIVAAGLLAACQQTEQADQTGATEEVAAVDVEAAQAAIEGSNETWQKAALAGDAATIASLYTADALLLPPYSERVEGKAAIEAYIGEMLATAGISAFDVVTSKTDIEGDLAYSTGTYTMTLTGPDGAGIEDRGKWLGVFRNVDGAWLMVADTWNGDLAPGGEAPATEPAAE